MRKYAISLLFFVIVSIQSVHAQNEKDDLPESLKVRLNSTQAEFPGGPEKMKKFIEKHKRYANKQDEQFKMGMVVVSFIVEKDGSIDSVKLTQSLTEYYNKEAIRLVKSMPHWKPATQNGQPVRTLFNFPIKF